MKRLVDLSVIEKLYLGLLLVIFGGIVLHAPLTMAVGAVWPQAALMIKAWKEVLMIIAAVLMLAVLVRKKQTGILREPLMIGIITYGALHIILAIFSARSLGSTTSGLLIDLRYVLFFALVYIAVRLYPAFRQVFVRVGIAGALVVTVFALLQVFVLPVDVLKYIGYNNSTIAPYLTVDQNTDYIRINSTLRGPNPLGAYAAIVLSVLLAWAVRKKGDTTPRQWVIASILLVGGAVALWVSYSRSALVGAIAAAGVIAALSVVKALGKKSWLIAGALVIIIAAGLYGARHTSFVENVILHDNPTTGAVGTSNEGHLSSLQDGLKLLLENPFGAGVGSTGSASFTTSAPLIIENQFLFIAHEVGWLGLVLFVMLLYGVMARLWQRRADWLALGVFASGIAMIIINLLLPIWVDDTVSIVWWGLAAIAICSKKGQGDE